MSTMLRRVILLSAVVFAASTALIYAQLPIRPGELTNRRLDYLGDASAVGWNPAMLGSNSVTELLLATTVRDRFDIGNTPFGVFAKLWYLGIGATSVTGDSLAIPNQYYVGFGLPVMEDFLWLGASLNWRDGGGAFDSGEWMLSGMIAPVDDVRASLTLENITANNNRDINVGASAYYSPFTWSSLHANLAYDPADTLLDQSPVRADLGLTFKLLEEQLVVSGTYEFSREEIRIGTELVLSGLMAGLIGNVTQPTGEYELSSGVVLARYSSEIAEKYGTMGTGATSTGWAPDRAYTPVGLSYKYSVNDAAKSGDALERACNSSGRKFDTPADLFATVRSAGDPYPALVTRLESLVTEPSNLYKDIRKTYYSSNVRSSELLSGDTLTLLSRQGYSIGVQSVDNSAFPLVSVIMQVTDNEGRNVRGLGKDDFAFRDTTLKILSVKPIDSTLSVPVDVTLIIDCSGSMGAEIAAVRDNARSFVNRMESSGADYRIGGILYGSMIYDTLHPTDNFSEFRDFVSNASAIGGDEISTLAVKAATEMNYRPDAQRVFVLITDDWVVQDNARLTEVDMTEMLWNTGARLYTIINSCKNNSAVATRLSLGREYDITAPFNSILDEIGTDITTTYQLTYESRLPEIPKVTILRGKVRDEVGQPAAVTLNMRNEATGTPLQANTNRTTGEYEVEIEEGSRYALTIDGTQYLPLTQALDFTQVKKGDTVIRDFVLKLPVTTLAGKVTDEKGVGVPAKVQIEDAETLDMVRVVETDAQGRYSTELEEGRQYRLTPIATGYIPTPDELDARGIARGTQMTKDLRVTSIDEAIATGATFRLKNIFFDFDKWDLKPESFTELNKLVGLLNEYPVINVEVGAHTDSKGSDSYNQTLSERRAQSVVDYLVEQGVVQTRLSAKGYGETTPVATNDTDEGRALNRRVEFKLVK